MLSGDAFMRKRVSTQLKFNWDNGVDANTDEEEWFKQKLQSLKPDERQQLGYTMCYI